MIGIYKDDNLFKNFHSELKLSEFLPFKLDELLKEFDFEALIYANGPGSYMGIKLSFLTLKTLSIVKNIPLFAVSAFELNGFKPIQANKKLCFIYENDKISLGCAQAAPFYLPQNLNQLNLNKNNEPFYFLEAI